MTALDIASAKQSASIDVAIARVTTALTSLEETVRRTSRTQAIQWAIAHADVGLFNYYTEDNYSEVTSKSLAVHCLTMFMKGPSSGRYVAGSIGRPQSTNHYYHDQDAQRAATEAENAKCIADFHAALITQLHCLTGEMPEIRKDNGKFAIFMPARGC